ncbi:MAG: DEAD/DEAH box helicase [Sulfolobales archaeon]|nr:DEAD/DEAH box helicase [Sulfolobales archaeon]MCX8209033.1 DEAD/DEAH box helicase [Sulfolobales archaeon]MDW8010064.1 DEAD/DEAH box helicase [Sulfolobales archaeon]
MGPSLEVRVCRWLSEEEFGEILKYADYVGRIGRCSIFKLNPARIAREDVDVEDLVAFLTDIEAEFDEDRLRSLLRREERVAELTYRSNYVYVKFNFFLGDELRDSLSEFKPRYVRGESAFLVHPMHYASFVEMLRRRGIAVVDRTGFLSRAKLDASVELKISLRDYQREALERWVKNGCRGIVALPTGSGKTLIAIAAIAETGERALIVVITKDHVRQWYDEIAKSSTIPLELVGFYYSEQKRVAPITIATYQSAFRYIGRLAPHFSLLIIDEVHHLPADKFKRIALGSPAPKRLGLSATPYREDGRHAELFPLMGGVVYYRSPAELAEAGFLARYEIVTVKVGLKPDEKKKYLELKKKFKNLVGEAKFDDILEAARRGDEKAVEALKLVTEMRKIFQMSRSKVEKVREVVEKERGSKIIVFAHYVELAKEIAREVGGLLLTGETETSKREEVLRTFRESKEGILVVTTVGDEGLDIPDASVGILVAGTSSPRQFAQRLGRLLRPGPGKVAKLYEVITRGTAEELHSKRRRDFSVVSELETGSEKSS